MTRQRTSHPHLFRCACGKVYSPTKKEASRLRREISETRGSDNPVRFYECGSGSWHWTSHIERELANG